MFSKKVYPLIPLKDTVIFPESQSILIVSRPKSILAIEKAYINNEQIFCVAQKKADTGDNVAVEDLFGVGVLCEIKQKMSMPNGDLKVFINGVEKVGLAEFDTKTPYFTCTVKAIRESRIKEDPNELEKMKKILLNKVDEFLKYSSKLPFEIFSSIISLNGNDILFILTSMLNITVGEKQELLEEKSRMAQYKKLYELLGTEIALINTEVQLNEKIERKMQEQQKKMFLNEKMRIIRQELKDDVEEDENDSSDVAVLKRGLAALNLSPEAREKCKNELNKLETIPSYSPEYGTVKNYLDTILKLPWDKKTQLKTDLKFVQKILDRDHYGLEEIKDRIVEYIAVCTRTRKPAGSIICFVGPPGVGKTSLAKSIAEATNRKYAKISLGGVRDEAEIRGHRKTYVGAMPGKIIETLKKVGVSNPVILLDEIDKMSKNYEGDPAAALLEVLDPEQNKSFNDHFLEIEYDISDVLFIATANNISNIPLPLQDRMEIIHLSGYTEDEKVEIAKRYIIPKEIKNNGLKPSEISITDETILLIIRKYTFEAGVRNLEKNIAKICRKVVKEVITSSSKESVRVSLKNAKKYLGVEKTDYNKSNKKDQIGITTGLAYTDFGGDLLYIEALKFDGSGKLNITGKLGDVMKESVQAAFSYVRSKAKDFGVDSKKFNKYDFHIHVPEGATPKDGPSAGIAIAGALFSCLTNMPIKANIAMTGEITLTGKVLPIGGLKEKLLSALRGEIKTVIIPKNNVKDLEKIPDKVKKNMQIVPVETVEEAFSVLIKDYDVKKASGKVAKAKGEKE